MHILGIETSCDDTAVSIITKQNFKLLSRAHVQYSQIPTHARFGGVVPEIAAREHAVTILPTLSHAFKTARLNVHKIDRIAVTRGPGLAPALSVGVDTARWLSMIYAKPLVGINHIEGHIASVWPISGIQQASRSTPKLPAIALVVSGGHTELLLVQSFGNYRLLGKTRDDAVGEAFDKVATLLGLPYPGGPEISREAQKGDRSAFRFPRPMLAEPNLEFSFAGLKTAVRYSLEKRKRKTPKLIRDVSASFEQAAVDTLVGKTIRALSKHKVKSLFVVGGVSANSHLRASFKSALPASVSLYLAPRKLTSDNATMICMAAALGVGQGSLTAWKTIEANPHWELGRK